MALRNFEYLEPTMTREACELLAKYGEDARIYAGGTSLLVLMKQGLFRPKYLVNIKRIPELNYIRYDEHEKLLKIGALVTHRTLETAPIIREKLPVVAEVEPEIANIRVRNVATIGGNFCFAEPLTDLPPILIGLETRVKIAGPKGDRTVPLENFFVDYYETILKSDEMLTEVQVPDAPAHTGIKYIRFAPGSDKPSVGVAVAMTLDPAKKTLNEVKVVLGCVAPTPMRAAQAEAVLKGREFNPRLVEEAARLASEECSPLTDIRGSESYKREIVRVLVKRAARVAYERARANGGLV